MKQKQGFTLIEIVITVSIITLLLGILFIPMLGSRRETASNTASINCGRAIQNAQTLYSSRNGGFATNMIDLADTNIALLDACDWGNPDTPYTVSGDDTAGPTFNFTVTYRDGDTPYRVTPNSITAIHE